MNCNRVGGMARNNADAGIVGCDGMYAGCAKHNLFDIGYRASHGGAVGGGSRHFAIGKREFLHIGKTHLTAAGHNQFQILTGQKI